jgi:hypothetical protein
MVIMSLYVLHAIHLLMQQIQPTEKGFKNQLARHSGNYIYHLL